MNYAKGYADAFVLNAPVTSDPEYLRGWNDGRVKSRKEYEDFQNDRLIEVEEIDDDDYDDYDNGDF